MDVFKMFIPFLPLSLVEVFSVFLMSVFLGTNVPYVDVLTYKEIVHVPNISQIQENQTHYQIPNFVALVGQHGYIAEEHVLTTSDGYILKLHRISSSPQSPKSSNKPVVYIQHGILLSSDSWVLIGPGKDLAFQLADAGKDVWIGNTRGNTYSHSHVNKSLPETEFWKFSYHEMAKYDIKTFVDFILERTGQNNLTYIGYSMGTTISYVFLQMYPEYNSKFNQVHSLAPVVYWKHELRRIPASVDKNINVIKKVIDFFEFQRLFPQSSIIAKIGAKYCADGNITQDFCAKYVASIGLDYQRMNKTAIPTILAHFPAGTSIENFFHYNQNKLAFNAFDYGTVENKKKYGQETPPAYDLTKVTAPVYIWYAKNDDIVNDKDVILLKQTLPNVVSCYEVPEVSFNHFDFLWARDVKELFYDKLMETL